MKESGNSDVWRRNLLRDFCLASVGLEEQFARFDASGALSFPIISELVGNRANKGLLWHLKDAAHHLFGGSAHGVSIGEVSRAGACLDWAIGFLFHECLQIMESAYQSQYYQPRLLLLAESGPEGCPVASGGGEDRPEPACALEGLSAELLRLSRQSRDVLDLHISRCRKALRLVRSLFCAYLRETGGNRLLDLFFKEREKLIARAFGDLCQELAAAVSL